MKIGIDIRTLMDKNYSGVSEHTLNLVREILKQDQQNKYNFFYNSGRDMSNRIPDFKQDNAKLINTRYPNKIFNWPMQKILKWPKLDKLLNTEVFYSPNISPIALSSQCRKIITIHDLSFLRYPSFFSLKRRWWHRIINVKKLINQFESIVAVSENTKNDIIELCKIPESRIKVVYPGISAEFIEINKKKKLEEKILQGIIKKYNIPQNFILFLGNIEPRKNVVAIIKAYNIFRDNNKDFEDIKLVIAGGNGWKVKNIFQEWRASKYKKDIKFLGYVKKEEKLYIYSLAKIFVFPSFYEGFGFPPLEAMASGVPVVSSFVSSLPEVVGDAGLLIDPYKEQEIALAFEEIFKNNILREKLIQRGIKRAKEFSWQKCAQQYLKIFKQ